MAFQVTMALLGVAIVVVVLAIIRNTIWLGKKRKPDQSLFLLDTLTSDDDDDRPKPRPSK
jgi:hypothetical protein